MKAKYVNGSRLDEVILTINGKGIFFHHHDALGSETQLTDVNGKVLESYTYSDFGTPTIKDASGKVLASSAYNNRSLFTGRSYWPELGIYDYRNRVYSSELGRFLQTDPMRFDAGDINIYRYCGNNPLAFVDPWGLGADLNYFPRGTIPNANLGSSNPNIFNVGAHGYPGGVVNQNGQRIPSYELANAIRNSGSYYNSEPVILVSCNVGNGDTSYGEDLANQLNASVTISDAPAYYDGGGHGYTDGNWITCFPGCVFSTE